MAAKADEHDVEKLYRTFLRTLLHVVLKCFPIKKVSSGLVSSKTSDRYEGNLVMCACSRGFLRVRWFSPATQRHADKVRCVCVCLAICSRCNPASRLKSAGIVSFLRPLTDQHYICWVDGGRDECNQIQLKETMLVFLVFFFFIIKNFIYQTKRMHN